MGDFLISVAAMTSFMTMVQLIVLALTISPSPGPQAGSRSERVDGVSGKSQPKRGEKVVRRKSAIHRTGATGRMAPRHHTNKGQRFGINESLCSQRGWSCGVNLED